MKRALALLLLSAFLVTVALIPAAESRRRTMQECYNDWEGCRIEAFASDATIIQTTMMLTACDIALGWCIFLG
jgi:hypothetical protein